LVSKIPFIKVIASGANTRLVGMTPEEIKKVRESSPEQLATGFEKKYRDQYAAVSPDGEKHWPIIAKKIWDLWLTPLILEDKDLALIKAPTLIINGDKDLIPVEHAVEIFKALPKGQLFIVPATEHHTFELAAERWTKDVLATLYSILYRTRVTRILTL
jgi:pimeloyl-ACP methyl ester carboxylesterase